MSHQKLPAEHWPVLDPLTVLRCPPSSSAGLLEMAHESDPLMWLPSISGSSPPVLPETLRVPLIVSPPSSMPPVLLEIVSVPVMVLSAHAGVPSSPPSPIITKPVVPNTVTLPLMVEPQKRMAAAPLELIPPLTLAPFKNSAPPELTLIPPLTFPLMQMDWPEVTV